ncbi:mechanosensitive ion channel protein MscS [Psychromonas sp. psych-6C06]|uniref:mechanosensitive ion channel domain-containing protein n=1 Tax=Psychromonas sp. psych-6C06 TaxID=2058089 RepID=UPI000C340ABB|nr:mechanosensitive ion channel family protein [Psychromonas sp. psych-6C06]PKF61677.1 mechanosensitive ion channel protein MscS [Psychromonas sp. psych-6C06]
MLLNIMLSIIFLIAFGFLKQFVNKQIQSQAKKKNVSDNRRKFIALCISSLLFALLFSIFLNVIDIGYGDVSLFLSSIFAVLGVALIAQWSMLSNVTASVLIFFVFPYRIGDRIKIENDEMTGVITDIGMFHLSIERDDGNVILYPNNLILQKSVIKITNIEKKTKKRTPVVVNRRPLTKREEN